MRLSTHFFFDDDDFVANVPFKLVMIRREDLVMLHRGTLGAFKIKSHPDAADEAGFSCAANPTVGPDGYHRFQRSSFSLSCSSSVSKCFCFGRAGWSLGRAAGSIKLLTPRTQASMSRRERNLLKSPFQIAAQCGRGVYGYHS